MIEEIIVHTGQQFDANMSDVFFGQLGMPTPKFGLGIAGLNRGAMTRRMFEHIESLLLKVRPDWGWSMETPTRRWRALLPPSSLGCRWRI